jgi:hypothetical protein
MDHGLWNLTGLAHRRVVRSTPIKGVTVIIRSVNFGKYSCDSTAQTYSISCQIIMQDTKENFYQKEYKNLDDILKTSNDCRQKNYLKSTDG